MKKNVIYIGTIGAKEVKKAKYKNLYIDMTLEELREIFGEYDYNFPKLDSLDDAMDCFDAIDDYTEDEVYEYYWYYHLLGIESEYLLGKIQIGDDYEYFELPYLKRHVKVLMG